MIKLGTLFSGIGAIEHALKRMDLPYEIVFASDNGDIDILTDPIEDNIEEIASKIEELDSLLMKISDKDWILKSKRDFGDVLADIKFQLVNCKIDAFEVLEFLENSIDDIAINNNQLKAYMKIIENLKEYTDLEQKYVAIKATIKLNNDLRRNNKLEILEHASRLFEKISEYKAINKSIKTLVEQISMTYEKVSIENIREEVFSLDTLEEQKKYVDSLYEGHEKRNKVKQSYFANYDIKEENFHWNVSFLDGKFYEDKIDLLVGGSPCQSFSLVGKQRGLSDTRGTLFYEYARIVKETQPKVFIYENVKAVLSNDNGNTWKVMTEIFDQLGYNWQYQILNAKDYGIPQNRERVFVVGFRNDLEVNEFQFPQKIPLNKTMQDFLINNANNKYYLPEKGVRFVTSEKNINKRYTQINGDIQLCQKKNQQFNWHGDFIYEENEVDIEKENLEKYFLSEKVKKYVLSSGTKGFYSKPKVDLEIARPLLTTMHKMHRAGVDNYVTTAGRLRKLTPRECLRLMGFCDSFKIVVSDTAIYQQAGNSIVVDVLIHLMESIISAYPDIIGE